MHILGNAQSAAEAHGTLPQTVHATVHTLACSLWGRGDGKGGAGTAPRATVPSPGVQSSAGSSRSHSPAERRVIDVSYCNVATFVFL